jgi:hypothetical protein
MGADPSHDTTVGKGMTRSHSSEAPAERVPAGCDCRYYQNSFEVALRLIRRPRESKPRRWIRAREGPRHVRRR